MNLKPHFYSESSKVGGAGCFLGFAVAYNLWFEIGAYLGIESDVPLRLYEKSLVYTAFGLGFFVLLISLLLFCMLSAGIYYRFKLRKGYLTRDEYINIVFKGVYPQKWKKGL